MPIPGVNYPGADLVTSPTIFQAPVIIGNAGGSLTLQPGVAQSQQGSSTVPGGATGSSTPFVTAAGQSGNVNPQGLAVLDSGVVNGSVLTAPSTLASFTAEAQLTGLSIPANDPAAGAVYLLRMAGVYSDTGTPTLAFGLRYGGAAGTSIAAIAAITLGSGVTGVPWDAEAILEFYDTTHAVGVIRLQLGTNASTGAASSFAGSSSAGVSVTSATAKVMSFTVTCSASSASNTISALTGYGMRLA